MAAFFMQAMAQLATEPTTQPTGLSISGNSYAYSFDISFDASGADRYLVLRSTQPISATPVDGVVYEKGEGLGNAKVFSNTSSTFLRIKEVIANTDYYFEIYAYNINNNDPVTANYLTTSPHTATITSSGNDMGSYYNSIDFSASSLLADLKTLINPHTPVSYGDFKNTIIPDFFERDTVGAQKVINCQYSNEVKVYTAPFGFSALNYTREHRMAFSWINFSNISRANFEDTPEGCDIHSLDLVQGSVNTQRLNYPFSSDIPNPSYTYIDFNQGRDSRNKSVAEVRDDRKGDVARALFYMMVAYNGKYSSNWGLDGLLSDAENQELSQLLDWHEQDPPDAFEIARHEYVYSQQGNRNPFIDHPGLVDCIDFTDLTLKGTCSGLVGIEDLVQNEVTIETYPQPARDLVNLIIYGTEFGTGDLTIHDLTGRTVQSQQIELMDRESRLQLQLGHLPNGYYIYNITIEQHQYTGKLSISR